MAGWQMIAAATIAHCPAQLFAFGVSAERQADPTVAFLTMHAPFWHERVQSLPVASPHTRPLTSVTVMPALAIGTHAAWLAPLIQQTPSHSLCAPAPSG